MNRIEMPQQKIKIDDFTNLLWDICESFYDSKNKIINLNKDWKINEDLRLLVFDFFIGTFYNGLYSLFFVEENLSKIEWWRTTKLLNSEKAKEVTEVDIKKTVEVYTSDVKINMIYNTFKNLETFMRDLHRNLYKTDNGKYQFYKIRDEVIKFSGLDNEFTNFIKLFQCIRNTTHNNGFHFNEDTTIIYKEVSYKFENGKPLTFLDLEFIRLLFIDTNKLLITLIQSENISNINEIVSLYSKIDFMNN